MKEPKGFELLGENLLQGACCTSLDDEDALARMRRETVAGTSGGWQLADPEDTPDGIVSMPCPDHPDTHRHVLFTP